MKLRFQFQLLYLLKYFNVNEYLSLIKQDALMGKIVETYVGMYIKIISSISAS